MRKAITLVFATAIALLYIGAVPAVASDTWFWFSGVQLGIVIGLAMVINLSVAALAGILVPLTLEKLGADPALASGTFVTTVTDVVGFFSFLGLASVILL